MACTEIDLPLIFVIWLHISCDTLIWEISGLSYDEAKAFIFLDVTWGNLVRGSWQLVAFYQPTLQNIKYTSISKKIESKIFYISRIPSEFVFFLSFTHQTGLLTSLFVQRPGFDKKGVNAISACAWKLEGCGKGKTNTDNCVGSISCVIF
jgi:hypothetical protein